MDRSIVKLINQLNLSVQNKKFQIVLSLTSSSLNFAKFLKKKKIISNIVKKDPSTWVIFLNNDGNAPVITKFEIMLLKNKNSFVSFKDYIKKSQNPFHIDIVGTSFGYFDQSEILKFKIGGILITRVYFI